MKQANFDVIIIGGGAAGLMCAFTAGQRGKRVLVLESSNKLGKKILMSGGGRCNFTNLEILPEYFLSNNRHFFKSALKQYTQWDFIALVAKHGIEYHEKMDGQLFCDHSAKDILSMLVQECEAVDVDIELNYQVESVSYRDGQYFLVNKQDMLSCHSLVIATGGLSIPTLGGATGFGYRIAEQFSIPVVDRVASLVPMTLSDKWHAVAKQLSGVSLPVMVSVPEKTFYADMLFTHRGLSGPAILQLSNYWQLGQPVKVDLLPYDSVESLTEQLQAAKLSSPNTKLATRLSQHFPKSVVEVLLPALFKLELSESQFKQPIKYLKQQEIKWLFEQLKSWQILPAGTEGYRTAEVTKGGVDVNFLSSKTLEVKHQKSLFFIGEVIDVTGHLGGYNFQWAWSSGYVAGMNV